MPPGSPFAQRAVATNSSIMTPAARHGAQATALTDDWIRRDCANSKALGPSTASLRSRHFRALQGEELPTLLSEEALPRGRSFRAAQDHDGAIR
jgi:hypothetical protein